MLGISRPKNISTKQQYIAKLASESPKMTFTSLAYHIDTQWLHEAYRRTRKAAAPGVDGQTANEYVQNLDANLESLLGRFKSGCYRAPPARRVKIPKGDGTSRKLGLPTFEDKILQRAVAMLLEPVYEQDFQDASHGFRPSRSCHTALASLWEGTMRMHGGWMLEVDVEDFFGTVDHSHLRDFLDRRVRDGVVRRAIDKWLGAGVIEKGRHVRSSSGTPQGGVLSPMLANIYLHEVIDRWFEEDVKPRMKGACLEIRYADDMVFVFAKRSDAERVMNVLAKRLDRFGLRLHPTKSRISDFRRPRSPWFGTRDNSQGKTRAFVFLGFTHYWALSAKGRRTQVIKRKTSSKSFSRALKRVSEYCRRNRHVPVGVQYKVLCRKIQGHYAYFGITGNGKALERFQKAIHPIWAKWLSRRNLRALATKFTNFVLLQQRYAFPPPRVVHSIYAVK